MNPPPPTPIIEIDGAAVQRNIQRMAKYAGDHGLQLRPHIKTHKSTRMAALQMQAGACGLTTAKIGEAEVMVEVCDDLLIAYPIVDVHRAERAARLAKRVSIRVAVDSARAIRVLSTAARQAASVIGILVDVDVGFHRTGVQSRQDALTLAQAVLSSPHLRLDGLFCYYGHIIPASYADPSTDVERVSFVLRSVLALWEEHGIQVGTVSGGTTPSAFCSHLIPELTEIRPGTYIYHDRNSLIAECCGIEDCAARIRATVVSTAVPGKAVIDAGSKTLTNDPSSQAGHGIVLDYPNAVLTRLTEEHGEIDVSACATSPRVGDVVYILPNHICPCVNLQDYFWLRYPDGTLERMPVDARGLVV